jgi:hypothetical protein
MMTTTIQQIICERVSFLKEQINQHNKPEVNNKFQVQVDAIRSAADNIENWNHDFAKEVSIEE